jgi:hypothetical protein
MPNKLQIQVAEAIARLGVAETSRRLGTDDETTLRLATPGARVRKGSIALAQANARRLAEQEKRAP